MLNDVNSSTVLNMFNVILIFPDGSREDLHNMDYLERKSRDKTKARGCAPQSFGYVKRSTSSSNGKGDPRTAQVSAVPRTKVI